VSPTATRATAATFATVLNLGLLALVVRTAAEAPPVWKETVMLAELVQVRGGANNAPAESAQAPKSPPREPAPTPPAPTQPRPEPSVQPATSPQPAVAAAPTAATPLRAAAALSAVDAPAPMAALRQGTREGLDIDAPNGTSNDYASRLRAWLEAHKTYPKRARMRREEGVVHLHFAVDRQGRLLAGDIVRSSGHQSLDTEALAMLDRSNPFPGAPHGVRGERIEISTPVEFFLSR
jgi:periplasmic protein TonB